MSTLKSSAENLTLNADGSGNDIKFQSNAVEKASLTDGGVFTATSFVDGVGGVVNRPNSKPLIINGNMSVAQRSTSTASITTAGFHTIDRMALELTTLGTWTQTQESLTSGDAFDDGFKNAFKMDCTTADASPSAGDLMDLCYRFESQDLQVLKKGTSNAEKVTLSFWVKSTKTGTFIAELYDHDNTRSCSTAYTVSSTDTWEKKVINVPADTTGALADDNGNGIFIYLWLGAGTTYTSGTLATAWASATNANRAVGQVNIADSTSNNFHITGMQLEVGEYTSATIPPFQHENYGDNLARCQRYYQSHYTGIRGAKGNGSAMVGFSMDLPVAMRAAATMTTTGTNSTYSDSAVIQSSVTINSITVSHHSDSMTYINFNLDSSGITDNRGYSIQSTAVVKMDAEL